MICLYQQQQWVKPCFVRVCIKVLSSICFGAAAAGGWLFSVLLYCAAEYWFELTMS